MKSWVGTGERREENGIRCEDNMSMLVMYYGNVPLNIADFSLVAGMPWR